MPFCLTLIDSICGYIENHMCKPYVLNFPFLFRSKSPSQAFLILVLWLYRKFKPLLDDGMAPEELMTMMSSTIVAYDNMCHVDGLKVARVDLPFEDPLKKVWQCVVKFIDKLHIRNHKDEKCPVHTYPDIFQSAIFSFRI